MPKNIAIFSTSWNSGYLYNYLKGISECAHSQNVNIHIFNTYGDSDEASYFNRNEYHIFELPDLSNFSGAIIISNNVGSTKWVKRLQNRITDAGIPCIGVEQEIEGFHYMGVDNYAASYELVSYLIEQKNCKSFYYIGGPFDNLENRERKKAFFDALHNHGLSCPIAAVKDYNFRIDNGIQAYWDFKKEGLSLPDAVISANDNMAIGFLQAAATQGYEAPKDFLITGFDNVQEASSFSPTITTVDRSVRELGYSSLLQLLDMIDGIKCKQTCYVPYTIIYAESTETDWKQQSLRDYKRAVFDAQTRKNMFRMNLDHIHLDYLEQQTIDNFLYQMNLFAAQHNIPGYAFCVNDQFQIDKYTKTPESYLLFGSKNGEKIYQENFPKQTLIPKQFMDLKRSHIYLYSPCHCGQIEHGYFVLLDSLELIDEKRLYTLLLTLNTILESMRQNLLLKLMNNRLNDLHNKDQMTGLYNRFALVEKGEKIIQDNRNNQKDTLLLFIDMDHLKQTNDTYGHNVGDMALKMIADVLQKNLPDDSYIGVRHGGDEFILLGNFYTEKAARALCDSLHRDLSDQCSIQKLPCPLSISIGYTVIQSDTSLSLEDAIKLADDKMYEQKLRKK